MDPGFRRDDDYLTQVNEMRRYSTAASHGRNTVGFASGNSSG